MPDPDKWGFWKVNPAKPDQPGELSDVAALSLPITLAAQSRQCWQALDDEAGAAPGQLPDARQIGWKTTSNRLLRSLPSKTVRGWNSSRAVLSLSLR